MNLCKKNLINLLCLFILLSYVNIGCSHLNENSTDSKSIPLNINNGNDVVKVIYDFADNINHKNYEKALEDIGGYLKGTYELRIDAFEKIDNMNVKLLIDKTGENENGRWYVNPRSVGTYVDAKVYYAEVIYKLNNLEDTYLKNGINCHKIVLIREKNGDPWRIGEMSSTDRLEKVK